MGHFGLARFWMRCANPIPTVPLKDRVARFDESTGRCARQRPMPGALAADAPMSAIRSR